MMFFKKKKVENITKEKMNMELTKWKEIELAINEKISILQSDLKVDMSNESKCVLEKGLKTLESEMKFVKAHIRKINEYINSNKAVNKNLFKMHETVYWNGTTA